MSTHNFIGTSSFASYDDGDDFDAPSMGSAYQKGKSRGKILVESEDACQVQETSSFGAFSMPDEEANSQFLK
jgi:hypothetical protein